MPESPLSSSMLKALSASPPSPPPSTPLSTARATATSATISRGSRTFTPNEPFSNFLDPPTPMLTPPWPMTATRPPPPAAKTTSPLSSPMLALAVCCVGSGPGCGTAVTSETMRVKGRLPCDCQACLPNPASAATRPVRTLPRCSRCCCCCPYKKDLLEESFDRCRKISTAWGFFWAVVARRTCPPCCRCQARIRRLSGTTKAWGLS